MVEVIQEVRKSKKQRLQIIHPKCASLDIGSQEHWVAVDPDKAEDPVRCFRSFTNSLKRWADWVEIVAMETTEVYWVPLFKLLDRHGFNYGWLTLIGTSSHIVLDCQ